VTIAKRNHNPSKSRAMRMAFFLRGGWQADPVDRTSVVTGNIFNLRSQFVISTEETKWPGEALSQ
jgi:hypothetical protein